MAKELNFEKDNEIDIDNLTKEFRSLPSILYGYREIEAKASEDFDLRKAEFKELRSAKYLEFRSREGKITESTLEAMLDTDPQIKEALRTMLSTKRDLETIRGYSESICFKKDMLIQIGADARKE